MCKKHNSYNNVFLLAQKYTIETGIQVYIYEFLNGQFTFNELQYVPEDLKSKAKLVEIPKTSKMISIGKGHYDLSTLSYESYYALTGKSISDFNNLKQIYGL